MPHRNGTFHDDMKIAVSYEDVSKWHFTVYLGVVLNGLCVVGKIVNLRSLKLERTFQLNELPFQKKNLEGLPTLTIFPTTISN